MDDKFLCDGDIAQKIDALIDTLEKRVDEAVALITQQALALGNTRKRRTTLSKLNWAAIHYLFIVKQWTATKIAERFDVSTKAIWQRCKRENWRRDGERAAPIPELTTAKVNIAATMLGALGLYNLRLPRM